MARKKVPQEGCLFCGQKPCVCHKAEVLCFKCGSRLAEDGVTCETCSAVGQLRQLVDRRRFEPQIDEQSDE